MDEFLQLCGYSTNLVTEPALAELVSHVMRHLPDTLRNFGAILTSFICAITDTDRGKIYNKITYPAIITGLLLSVWPGSLAPYQSLCGFGGALLFYGLLRHLSGLGAGDVKLMAAIGAFKGFPFVIFSSFYILCFGCLLGIVTLAYKGRLVPALKWLGGMVLGTFVPGMNRPALEAGGTTMPFGPAILLGTGFSIYLEHLNGLFTI